jgi:hypothetical protein
MLLVSVAGAAALLLPGDRVITVASAALIVPPAVVAASRMAWSGGSSGVFRRWVVPGLALLALGRVAAFGVIADPWPFAVPAVAWLVGLGYDRWHRHRSARKVTPLDP